MVLEIILGLIIIIWILKKNSGNIPGPWNLPLCGSTPFIIFHDRQMLAYPYRLMHRLSQSYGTVFKVGLGDQDFYVISSFPEIKEFAMAEESVTHLPSQTFDEIYSFNRPLGIIFPDGPLWREQRKFGVKTLRQLGVGKSSLEEKMLLETEKCCQHLGELVNGQSGLVRMDDFFDLPCLNIIWGLVNSTRSDYNDKDLKKQIELINKFTMDSAIGPLVGVKYLKYIPPFSGIYNSIKQHMDIFKAYMTDLVAKEQSLFVEGNSQGYIDYFLEEKNKTSTTFYEDKQLVVTLIDFFTGGSGTMSKTLAFGILYCLKNPDVHKKVQTEIDQKLGDKLTVELEDKESLPYTEAVVTEVSRLASVLPIAPPRKTTGDVKVGSHTIPKGGLVQMNLYSMHRNKEHWGDPENFRPERFMENGKFVQDDWVQPFGYGKRKCLGENIARNNTFLMFANVMRQFNFTEAASHPLPSLEPVGGLSIGPQPFSCTVTQRQTNS